MDFSSPAKNHYLYFLKLPNKNNYIKVNLRKLQLDKEYRKWKLWQKREWNMKRWRLNSSIVSKN